jgi:Putative Ig domain
MTATNAAGTSKSGAWSNFVTVGGSSPTLATVGASSPTLATVGASPPTLDDRPAHTGFVGLPYLSRFAVSGMEDPSVTLEAGRIPPGLILEDDGTLSGTATRAGEYKFGVLATNGFGYHRGVATVTIAETGAPHPETRWQDMRAEICTEGGCATRLLFGPFRRLDNRAEVSLVRGPTTYATGHVTGDGSLALRRRCGGPPVERRQCEQPTFGHYTLALHRKDRSTFVPVTLH